MVDGRPDYSGMTLNERLFTAGLHPEFDAAILTRDRARAVAVLAQVDMTPEQAAFTVDATLGDPAKYGYPTSQT